jgi:hypothetical protein
MRAKMRPELRPARTLSAPAGQAKAGYRPWIEVAARVRVSVPGWGLDEAGWVHWAVPVRQGRPEPEAATTFDPGRRAAFPGEPPGELRRDEASLDVSAAARLCEALLARWQPRVYFHPVLGVASRLDEPLEDFRRRCMRLLEPVMRGAAASGREAPDQTRLVAPIESLSLPGDRLQVLSLRAGVGWYPEGVEPAPPPADPLMQGQAWRPR